METEERSDPATTTWRVQMFGGLQVVDDPGAVVIRRFRTRRAALLLAFLAMKPGESRTRGQICEMLWPEEDPQIQRSRLRFELSTLRSLLGAAFFAADQGNATLALAAVVTSDVAEFDALLIRAARLQAREERIALLRQAVALYRGDLLPELDLPEGCPPEFDWLSLERGRLQEAAATAVVTLIADLHVVGLHTEARQLNQEARVLFPYLDEIAEEQASQDEPMQAASLLRAPQTLVTYAVSPPVHLLQGPFFGREAELLSLRRWATGSPIAQVKAAKGTSARTLPPLLPEHRLVTILGPGGVGKTRLLIEGLMGHADAILVPLSGASQKGEIYDAIAQALALPRRPSLPVRNQLIQALNVRRTCLLLLDNCEHLVEDCAACVSDLLRECPQLRIGTTSQHALMLAEEQKIPIAPLPPNPARALFLERARAVQPRFADTPAGCAIAEEVADLLGGFPLALELAAARAVILEPQQMRDQLRRQLNFLASAHPSRPVRHRSMRAALQWSVGLLSEEARRTLSLLSLFRSGATIEAVQAVVGDSESLMDALEELRLYSLLIVRFAGSEESLSRTRYDLLFHVRAYAAELLTASDQHAGWERHADFWMQQVASVPQAFHWGQWEKIRHLLLPDMENIRGAIDGCVRRALGPALYRLIDALGTVFLELGYWEDEELLLRCAEETPQLEAEQRIRILGLRGALERRRGNEEQACLAWERRLALARQSKDADLEAMILFDLAGQAIDRNQFARAKVFIEEGVAVTKWAALEARHVVGYVLMARLCLAQEQQSEATVWAETAWSALPQTRDSVALYLYTLISLLPVFRACDQHARVEEIIHSSLPLVLETGQAYILARLLDEAAPFWEMRGLLEATELGLFISSEIHEELGSRFVEASQAAWNNWKLRRRILAREGEDVSDDIRREARTGKPASSWRQAADKLRLLSL